MNKLTSSSFQDYGILFWNTSALASNEYADSDKQTGEP